MPCSVKYGSDGKKTKPTPPTIAPTLAVPAVTWELVLEPTGGLTTGGGGIFSGEIENFMASVMQCLIAHQNDAAGTDRHEEDTIWTSKKENTRTVDYQGTRAGNNAFWIDLQGQQGKKSQRNSYWQLMVQTSLGVPSKQNVALAIRSSWKNKQRGVLHRQGGPFPISG